MGSARVHDNSPRTVAVSADSNTLHARLALLSVLCLAESLSCAATSNDVERYSSLTAYCNTYVNSCSRNGRRQLRIELFSRKIPDKQQLWKADETLLCADQTRANKRYIASIMTSKVSDTNEGTGQDPQYDAIKPSIDSAASLLATRSAWDARLDVDADGVSVSYHSDEVCVSSRKFRKMKRRWRIVEVGQACD